jgi:hypothetical protein
MSNFSNNTLYLKTDNTRQEVLGRIRQHTLLETKDYKNDPSTKKFFRGELSEEEAWLTTIDPKARLAPHIHVRLRGIEHEMFLLVNLRMHGNMAFPIFLFLFFGGAAWLLFKQFSIWGNEAFSRAEVWLLAPIALLLVAFMLWRWLRFRRDAENTLDFIRGLTEADLVKEEDVPVVFRLR